ncbi:3-phytase [Siphonobacter sp. BAB-5405]|uniref:phytase n=1 Tax=Siphonobacter sp. BAB-5405 TaxID=1864825 RepID=UPI000C806692|nr:phytase [Siphonobacter sp. BAB-5405]PMD95869.1 3-phytase [Siphonobacter sp. BAB-5405]
MFLKTSSLLVASLALLASCQRPKTSRQAVKPLYVTEKVAHDSDDPAVWINPQDPAKSLIIGTDKDADGGLYVFNLQGKIQQKVGGLQRPNNVDIEYGLMLNGKATDIAVTTERMTHKLRIFSLPEMKPLDNGGIPVFEGEMQPDYRDLMGISMYKNKQGVIYAIVGRKTGPTTGGYLWQYRLDDDGTGHIKATLVRKFGTYSGLKEIESIAVDDKLGYVYYSDEGKGVRQYYADPEKGNEELALFATENFKQDHEGISIYELTDSTGYILVSDQGANRFQIFSREGTPERPFEHKLLKTVDVRAMESDGSDMVSVPLNQDFKHGLFVVMSTDRTFHLYRWEDIAGPELKLRP